MALSLRVGMTIALAALSLPGFCRAQNKNKPQKVQTYSIAGEVRGTQVKKTPALTDDDIALLAPRAAVNPAANPKAEAAVEPATKGSAEAAQDPDKRKAEIASLEQQIKEKQLKIQLLMRMFVLDEQVFLKDPSGQSEEEGARAKRRFEQEELLQEGKEIARLRARLGVLTSAYSAQSAPAKSAAKN